MKFKQILKFNHHLREFISIQLLIQVVWGASFGIALNSLLISEVRLGLRKN